MTPKPARPGRITALDDARGFITLLVVLHHAVLAYIRFGHFNARHYTWSTAPVVDSERWLGFDILVLLNDSWFMPAMFLLAGLFVTAGLARSGGPVYLRRRLLRLGLPFAFAVLTVIPLAYYPSYRLAGGHAGFAEFWAGMVGAGPWPSGPPWFIGVLLVFDLAIAAAWTAGAGRWLTAPRLPAPAACAGLLLLASTIATLPLLLRFDPMTWLSLGPFAVQASRIGLYAVYFLAGVLAGRGLQDEEWRARLAGSWQGGSLAATALFLLLLGAQWLRLTDPELLSRRSWLFVQAAAFLPFCVAACLAVIAAFLRLPRANRAIWNSLDANAYGIFLLHYPIVTWTQFALLPWHAGPIAKALLVFTAAITASWTAAACVRRIPRVAEFV